MRPVTESPKRTGLVCPACNRPVAVVETDAKRELLFWCPACGHRWSATRMTDPSFKQIADGAARLRHGGLAASLRLWQAGGL